MTHIEVWLYPKCMASAVSGPLDVFAVANALWLKQRIKQEQRMPLFSWSLHSIDGAAIQTPVGINLQADSRIADDAKADIVLLPGIYFGDGVPEFLQDLQMMSPLLPILRARHAQGSLLAANCSASFLLAEAGLLDGGHATTSWLLERTFKARYPQIELRLGEILDASQGILSTGAATSYLNLALHLVERFAGPEMATSVAKALLIDANRNTQMPYINLLSMTQQDAQTHTNTLVHRAQKWLRQHSHLPFRLSALADYLAISERTLIRHFHQALNSTPASYAQLLKIDLAKRLLETSTLSLAQVAERIAYTDSSSFRRLFKRHTGLSPAAYRAQFKPQKSSAAGSEE